MQPPATDQDFVQHLREEKLATQKARADYTLHKLAYATALLGAGSIQVELQRFDLSWLLYLVPLVALTFDLYILGEDLSIKRIGAFLRSSSVTPAEQQWEQWSARNRDVFAPFAMPLLSTLLLAAAALINWHKSAGQVGSTPLFWVWLAAFGLPIWGLYFYYRQRRRSVDQSLVAASPAAQPGPDVAIPDMAIHALQAAADRAGHLLSEEVYWQAKALFATCQADPAMQSRLTALAPEYVKQEFLQNVDEQGNAVPASARMLQDARQEMAHDPAFGHWFQLAEDSPQRQVLLVARWLCHLAGIRHRTVHLFIDHPALPDHTLVQVRALDKLDFPGCFDLPVAGHVVGLQPTEQALIQELGEELGLYPQDLQNLRPVGAYDRPSPPTETGRRDIEFRQVYAARLSPDALGKIRFADGEVAAISVFALDELADLAARFPERIASGLAHSLELYAQGALALGQQPPLRRPDAAPTRAGR